MGKQTLPNIDMINMNLDQPRNQLVFKSWKEANYIKLKIYVEISKKHHVKNEQTAFLISIVKLMRLLHCNKLFQESPSGNEQTH